MEGDGFETQDVSQFCGWVDHPDRQLVAATLGPPLSQVAPQLYTGDDKDVFLYKAWKAVLGQYPDYPAQQIGDCTSFGGAHAIDLLQCVQISIGHKSETFKEICTEALYGMGREIGGMLGSGDGCFGSAIAKAALEGVVPREVVGPYSGQRAKQWGGRGVPADIKTKAREHPVGNTALVATCDDVDAALGNGHPCTVASSQGFTMTRDGDGVCQPRGRWDHQLAIVGRRRRNGRRQYLIAQSWGPSTPAGPVTDDQPTFTFWIDEDPMASMLANRDSWAFAGLNGFARVLLPHVWI